MKKSMTLIVLVLFLVLLVGLYFGVIKNRHSEQETTVENTTEKVLEFSEWDVNVISFRLDGKEVKFALVDNNWILEGNDDFKVDRLKVDHAISALADMNSVRTLEDVSDLKEYGLDQPMQVVTVGFVDGTTKVVSFGDINDTTANSYVCLAENTSKVYTVPYSVERSFEGSLEDFRTSQKTSENAQ